MKAPWTKSSAAAPVTSATTAAPEALKGLRGDAAKLWKSTQGLGENMITGARKMGGDLGGAGKSGQGVVGGLVTVAKQPLRWGIQAARGGVQLTSAAFKRVPWIAYPAAIFGTAALVGGAMRKGAEKKAERELAATVAAGPQATAAAYNYHNTASQAEIDAAMAARQAQTGSPVSRSEAVLAERAAAQQSQAAPSPAA